jgi:hypothetical protein
MFCACAGRLANGTTPLSRYDLTSQAGGEAFNPLFASVHAGGLFQHGLSAAGGVYGFFKHRSAADKR